MQQCCQKRLPFRIKIRKQQAFEQEYPSYDQLNQLPAYLSSNAPPT